MATKDLLIDTLNNFTMDGSLSKTDESFIKEKLDDCITKKRFILKSVIAPLGKGCLSETYKKIISDNKKIVIKIINNYGE